MRKAAARCSRKIEVCCKKVLSEEVELLADGADLCIVDHRPRFLARHSSDEAVEVGAVCVEHLCAADVGSATDASDVEFGVVLCGWRPATNDLFGRTAVVLVIIIEQQDDGCAIAIDNIVEAAKPIDIGRAGGESFPLVSGRIANVERIAVALSE